MAAAAPQPQAEAGPAPQPSPPPAKRAQRARASQEPKAPRPPQPRAEPAPAADPPRASATRSERRSPPPPVLPEDDAPSPELAALRDRHAEIRDAARAGHQTAGALLNSRCYIKSFEGDTVEIGFQSQLLVEKALGDPAVLQAIRGAVGGIAGRPVEVVPMVWEALQNAAPISPTRADPPTPDSAASDAPNRGAGGHLIEEARKLGAVPVED